MYYIKGKYTAKIVFQKKQYYLGNYESAQEAAMARQEAEHLLFDGTAEHYAKWESRASADPQWAMENPIRILVDKGDKNSLRVTFLPNL